MIEVGRICKKIAGREKGRYCLVIKLEGKFAEISGAKKYGMCKRKRCNLKHLVPTKFKIHLKGEKQEDLEKSISESGIIKKLSLIKDKKIKRKIKPVVKKEKKRIPKPKKKSEEVKKTETKKKEERPKLKSGPKGMTKKEPEKKTKKA